MRALSANKYFLGLIGILYLLSLALPCTLWDDYPTDRRQFGFEILVMGWAGVLSGDFLWFANPAFLIIFHRAWNNRPMPARWILCMFVLLPALAVFFPELHTRHGLITLSWYLAHAKEVLLGPYIWAMCMLLTATVCVTAPGNAFRRSPMTASGR